MWILILTLITGAGSVIHTVEFETQNQCMIAANAWVAQVTPSDRSDFRRNALCVASRK